MSIDFRKGLTMQRAILEEFIETYRQEVCLWNVKDKTYHKRDMRLAAYDKLVNIFQQIEPNADREKVIKKINSMRTNIRKEKKKIKAASRSDIVYKPQLWYYHYFDFLTEQESPSQSQINLKTERNQFEQQEADEYDPLQFEEEKIAVAQDPVSSYSSKSTFKRPRTQNATSSSDKCGTILNSKEAQFKRSKWPDDRYDILGKNVTLKMKDIKSVSQRLIAEKLINDALFMAEMNQLTLLHTINAPTLNADSPVLVSQFSPTHSNYGYRQTRCAHADINDELVYGTGTNENSDDKHDDSFISNNEDEEL